MCPFGKHELKNETWFMTMSIAYIDYDRSRSNSPHIPTPAMSAILDLCHKSVREKEMSSNQLETRDIDVQNYTGPRQQHIITHIYSQNPHKYQSVVVYSIVPRHVKHSCDSLHKTIEHWLCQLREHSHQHKERSHGDGCSVAQFIECEIQEA